MSLDLESMLKAILESQERVISRSSTSCERAYEPTTSLEYQPHGDFGQGHQYRYGERHQPWDLEYEEEEETNFPQDSNEEDITNMLEKLLENQERGRIEMERQLDSLSNKIDANGKTLSSRLDRVVAHVKSFNNNISHVIEDQEESATPLHNANTYEAHTTYMECDFEEDAQLEDDFQHEAEEPIYKFKSLSECMVDENLIIRSEEQTKTMTFMSHYANIDEEEVGFVENTLEDLGDENLVVECVEETKESLVFINEFLSEEETRVIPVAKEEAKGEESVENQMNYIKESSEEVQEEESPVEKPFQNHFGILSTKELKRDDPRKIPFEEIRMNEFRGWFYDEYDPGDHGCLDKAFCGPPLA